MNGWERLVEAANQTTVVIAQRTERKKGVMKKEWKRYKVMAMIERPGEVCVVEAPTPGLALEHYLAGHGMLGYNRAFVEETKAHQASISPGLIQRNSRAYTA